MGKERREGPQAGGPGAGRGVCSRNPHSGSSVGVAGPRALDSHERAPSGRRLAVHPREDPGPREGARKA